jgi:pimeloyl-ACP methyl ester carboxylesterase
VRPKARILLSIAAAPFLTAAAVAARTQPRPAPQKPARILLEPCDVPGLPGKARCGTYEVHENRGTRRGRKIRLKIVELPATGKDPAPEPLAFINGGPGESATEAAAGLAQEFAKVRQRHDILLVDQRGTGGSHPLNCEMFVPPDNLQSYLRDFFPPDSVRTCRERLAKDADLTLYTTPIAMDDLDEVRAALGHERLNLFGGSYGTRAALVYLRQHPEHVRTATLQGVVPTDDRMPLHIPQKSERALSGIFDECAAEAACHEAFPDLREESRSVFDRLSRAPAAVRILHPQTGDPAEVSLSHDLAAEAVRYMLYSPAAAGEIPIVLHQAALGDFTPLAERALFGRQQIVASGSNGLYLSITCAEDVPWIRAGEGERAAEGTFLGDYRLRQQRAACALWPRGRIPKDYLEPVRSTAPALLLSGMWDPATPPSDGEMVAKFLPNGLHVVVPHGGHSYEGLEGVDCVKNLAADFIERGTTKGLDTSCVDKIRRPAFRVAPMETKLIRLEESELVKLAGSYLEEGKPVVMTVEVHEGKLIFAAPGEKLILAPVSPTRFRVASYPGLLMTFEVVDGQIHSLVVTQGGSPVHRLVPKKEGEPVR